MDEPLFEAPGVRITAKMATLSETTYPIAGVTNVRVATETPSVLPVVLFAVPAFGLLVCGGTSPDPGVGHPLLGGGALLAVLAGLATFGRSTRYFVVLGTAGGDRKAFATRDRDTAQRVRQALERAISGG